MTSSLSRLMDTYIYVKAVLPLKFLEIENPSCPNPFKSKVTGRYTKLSVHREEIQRSNYNYNYERDLARQNARWLVYLMAGSTSRVIASYEASRHRVTVYRAAAAIDKTYGMVIFRRLVALFNESYPFKKVVIEEGDFDPTPPGVERVEARVDDGREEFDWYEGPDEEDESGVDYD